MTTTMKADLCIIGAGAAGLSVAAGAAQLGRKVVLIEKGDMGGDCLNYGCVPSKALIAAAERAHAMRHAEEFGVRSVDPEIDFAAVMDHVHGVIATIAPVDSQERFEGFGVTVLRAAAAFIGPRTVRAGDHEITAKHLVIATGSTPFIPPISGLDNVPYLTNETIFANRTLPPRLIVIGGGPIGVELAQAHRRLGAETTIIEGDTILNRDDAEAVEIIRATLKAEGVRLHEKSKAARVEKTDGGVRLHLDDGGTIDGSHLLVAVGRRADFSALGLEAAGVETDGGKLKLDDRLRTTNKRIYAIGDAAGGLQFTHVAGDHASTLVRNILFKMPAKRRDALAPRVTYCDPEIASVGLSEKDARARYDDISVARWAYEENDRAQTERQTQGFIKALIRKNGAIIGATIVGKGAGDAIGLWAFALANRLKISAFTNYIAPYPTRGEVSKRAGGAFYTPTLFSDRTRAVVRLLSVFD